MVAVSQSYTVTYLFFWTSVPDSCCLVFIRLHAGAAEEPWALLVIYRLRLFFVEQEPWYFFCRSPAASWAVGALLQPPCWLCVLLLLLFSSTPYAFAGVRAVKRTALLFLHQFSLWSWAAPDSLILCRTALCAAAFSLVTQLGGKCSGLTCLAGRYCHNCHSQNRKWSPSVCLVRVSPLLKQPYRSFVSDMLYCVSKPIWYC